MAKKVLDNKPTLDEYIKVYEQSLALENALKSDPDYKLTAAVPAKADWLKNLRIANGNYESERNPKHPNFSQILSNPYISKEARDYIIEDSKKYVPNFYYKQETPNTFYQRELSYGRINDKFPMPYYDARIQPTLQVVYQKEGKQQDRVQMYKYDVPVLREQVVKLFPEAEEKLKAVEQKFNKPVATTQAAQPVQSGYPSGYAPYSLYGKVLDPKVYGYGESTSGTPIQVAQFLDTYGLQRKMKEYSKDNSFPWSAQKETTFDNGGVVLKRDIQKNAALVPKQKTVTLNTHDNEYSNIPKIRDADKTYYDDTTGTIYLSPEDAKNNDVIKDLEAQHYKLQYYKDLDKQGVAFKEKNRVKSFQSVPFDSNFNFNFNTDAKQEADNIKQITGVNTSLDVNTPFGLSVGADASFKKDADRVLFALKNQRVGLQGNAGNYSFGVNANNSFDENGKPLSNPNTTAFIQKNNFRVEGNNSFQKQEDGTYSFNPNATFSYDDGRNSLSVKHEFIKGEDGKWKTTPSFSGNVKRGNWDFGQSVSPFRDEEGNLNTDTSTSIGYTSPNERFNVGATRNTSSFNNESPQFNSGNLNMSYMQPVGRNVNLNVSGSNEFTKEDMLNPNLKLGVNYGGKNNPMSINIGNEFKEGSLFNPTVGFRYKLKNGGTMNEQLMQQVQQMIEQGASKGDVAQQLMAAVQEGQLDQESVMQVFQQLGITEQDLQQMQQPQQPSEAQQQVMALGGMPRFPNGGQPSPEEMAMMQQQQAQQQGAPQEQQQGGGDQMQQVMQMVQQMVQQGAQPVDIVQALLQNQLPPEAIMQVLTQMGMEPEEAQATIQQVMQGGQQQPQQQQGPGEEQVEGESSNPEEEEEEEEEQQELPQQAFGSQLKKLISNHSKSELTSEVDSDIHSATRNLKFANTLRKNAHEAMLNEAFDFPSLKNNSNSNSLPQAAYGDEVKALQEKYKDDPEYKKYLDEQKAYTDWKTNQGQQGQGQGQPGVNNIYYVNDPRGGGSQSTYQNPGAFSRLFNNSGWTSDRLGFDFSNLPLSNDPDAKYNVTAITPEKGILGRRKVRYDINWGTTPNDASTTGTGATGTTPAAEPLSNRQIRRNARNLTDDYEDVLDKKIDGVDKDQSKADQLSDKYNASNELIEGKFNNGLYKDQTNPYSGKYIDPTEYFEDDNNVSRRDIKGYYKEVYPNMPRKDVRQLTRESNDSRKIITGVEGRNFRDGSYEIPASKDDANGIGDFFRNTAYNVRTGISNIGTGISNAFGHLSNKSYGGLIQAGPGINMSTDEDKPATALNQKGSVTVKEKFKLDMDAFADASKLTADTISSNLNRAYLQERANDPDQYSAMNRFSPTAYPHASRGLYDEQGSFKPDNVGATTIFNPTNAEGSFYKQLFALGGGVNKITFTDEELQVLKDAGYNTDDLI